MTHRSHKKPSDRVHNPERLDKQARMLEHWLCKGSNIEVHDDGKTVSTWTEGKGDDKD